MLTLLSPSLITALVLIAVATFMFCMHRTAASAIGRGFGPVRAWRLPVFCTVMTGIALMMLLSGCTAFSRNVAPAVAKAVTRYCAEPVDERMAIRNQVKTLTAPNSIQVNCASDTP